MSSVTPKNKSRSQRCYENHRVVGIYKIINKVNGKYYVGSSKNISGYNGRWKRHKMFLKSGSHKNTHLQSAWNKYGEQQFDFVIIENVSEEKLIETEQKYLDIAKLEQDKCYNMYFFAGGGDLGKEIYELRGKKYKWYNKGISNPNYGKPLPEEVKKKMSVAKNGLYDGAKHPLYDHTIYQFRNKRTGEKLKCTKFQLKEKTKSDHVYNLVAGKLKCVCGWELFNSHQT